MDIEIKDGNLVVTMPLDADGPKTKGGEGDKTIIAGSTATRWPIKGLPNATVMAYALIPNSQLDSLRKGVKSGK